MGKSSGPARTRTTYTEHTRRQSDSHSRLLPQFAKTMLYLRRTHWPLLHMIFLTAICQQLYLSSFLHSIYTRLKRRSVALHTVEHIAASIFRSHLFQFAHKAIIWKSENTNIAAADYTANARKLIWILPWFFISIEWFFFSCRFPLPVASISNLSILSSHERTRREVSHVHVFVYLFCIGSNLCGSGVVVHVHQGTCVNHIDTCWNRWCHFCSIHFGAHLIFIVVTSFIWQQEGILFRMEGTIACPCALSHTHTTQHIHTSTEDNCKWENAMLSWHAEMLLEWTTQMFVMCRLYRFSNECFCYCCCCCLLSSTVLSQPISISFLRRNEQTKDENEK